MSAVTDPYRWLEDQDSPRTRAWIEEQTRYARATLDAFPGASASVERIREFLAVETYDSLQKAGNRYFFRKRLPNQEQPCIYMRDGADGEDHLLIDPIRKADRRIFTAVKPLRVSPDGRLLLYEVKEGGERTGTFRAARNRNSEAPSRSPPPRVLAWIRLRAGWQEFLLRPRSGRGEAAFLSRRVSARSGNAIQRRSGDFLCGRRREDPAGVSFLTETPRLLRLSIPRQDAHGHLPEDPSTERPRQNAIFRGIDYSLGLRLMDDKILAITDRDAPNRRIVEIRLQRKRTNTNGSTSFPRPTRLSAIGVIVGDRIFVSYMKEMTHRIFVFDFSGKDWVRCRFEATKRFASSAVRQIAMSCSSKRNRSPNPSASSVTPAKTTSVPLGQEKHAV